ncbi:short-chain dehydrogenase/reductase SDR [Flagelloscypha sp. PMI_526]|nr:short-chain dehydrogenase/reductase SDR [Flagelloscypha sp. PMI_526]
MSVSGKVAIVTGGASGIGLGIVNRFLAEGANVAVFDISNLEQFDGQANVLALKTDVSKDVEVNASIDKVIEKWGQLNVLVNNAGIMDNFYPIGEVPDATWEKSFGVNVNGVMYLSRRAIKIYQGQESKGTIVNIASTAAARGSAAGVAYTATKHAVLGITRSTAFHYAKEGITCNAVLPGAVPGTNIVADPSALYMPGYMTTEPFMKVSPGQLTVDDIASTVLFLATNKAINGAEVAADKGWLTA